MDRPIWNLRSLARLQVLPLAACDLMNETFFLAPGEGGSEGSEGSEGWGDGRSREFGSMFTLPLSNIAPMGGYLEDQIPFLGTVSEVPC